METNSCEQYFLTIFFSSFSSRGFARTSFMPSEINLACSEAITNAVTAIIGVLALLGAAIGSCFRR